MEPILLVLLSFLFLSVLQSLPFSFEGASAFLSHLFVSFYRATTGMPMCSFLSVLDIHQAFRLLFNGGGPLVLE